MPSKDPVKRAKVQKEWMDRNIEAGYGKWLYAKRRLIKEDADEFRAVLEDILQVDTIEAARLLASEALVEADRRLKKLGTWTEKRVFSEVTRENSPDPEKGNSNAKRSKKKSSE